jgi:hypothetical protein
MQRVYPGLSPNIPEGWVMAPHACRYEKSRLAMLPVVASLSGAEAY